MTNYDKNFVQKMQSEYSEKQTTKLDTLRELDKKVKNPALIFALVFGIIGSLILGTGMCLAMKIIGDDMVLGILIGIVGIAMVSVNYFIYGKILASRKKKYNAQINSLCDEILAE